MGYVGAAVPQMNTQKTPGAAAAPAPATAGGGTVPGAPPWVPVIHALMPMLAALFSQIFGGGQMGGIGPPHRGV